MGHWHTWLHTRDTVWTGLRVWCTKVALQSAYFERPPERIAESALARLEHLHVRAITRASSPELLLLYSTLYFIVLDLSTLFMATLLHCDSARSNTLASHESLSYLQETLSGADSAH